MRSLHSTSVSNIILSKSTSHTIIAHPLYYAAFFMPSIIYKHIHLSSSSFSPGFSSGWWSPVYSLQSTAAWFLSPGLSSSLVFGFKMNYTKLFRIQLQRTVNAQVHLTTRTILHFFIIVSSNKEHFFSRRFTEHRHSKSSYDDHHHFSS